jgi:hypothetical protein
MKNLYRKKPVVIEAIQFNGMNWEEIQLFTNGLVRDFDFGGRFDGKVTCIIPTLEGEHIATQDDYIIKGVNGEFYPCKPDIFKKTYEKVD